MLDPLGESCLGGPDVEGYSKNAGPDPVSYPVGSANRMARGGSFATRPRTRVRPIAPARPETVSDGLGLRPVRAILP